MKTFFLKFKDKDRNEIVWKIIKSNLFVLPKKLFLSFFLSFSSSLFLFSFFNNQFNFYQINKFRATLIFATKKKSEQHYYTEVIEKRKIKRKEYLFICIFLITFQIFESINTGIKNFNQFIRVI